MPIYVSEVAIDGINPADASLLIRANTRGSAVNHANRVVFDAHLATQDELVDLVASQTPIENAVLAEGETSKIFVITNQINNAVTLVRAGNIAAAIRHAGEKNRLSVRVASQEDIVTLVSRGLPVIDVRRDADDGDAPENADGSTATTENSAAAAQ